LALLVVVALEFVLAAALEFLVLLLSQELELSVLLCL